MMTVGRKESGLTAQQITIAQKHRLLIEHRDRLCFPLVGRILVSLQAVLTELMKRPVPYALMASNKINVKFKSDSTQKEAAVMALNNNLTLIAGFAGTGKTAITTLIVRVIVGQGNSVVLTSFTGKAVSRLREQINELDPELLQQHAEQVTIATMDSLLARGERISCQFLIVDEASMVSLDQFYSFVRIMRQIPYMVFIGDENQLPPMRWGQLLNSLRRTNFKAKIQLKKNYRQDAGLSANIQRILQGQMIQRTPDCHLFSDFNYKTEEAVAACYFELVQKYGNDFNKVTLVAPCNKIVNGVNNKIRERRFETSGSGGASKVSNRTKDYKWFRFNIGDRVRFTKNKASEDIYNGLEGMVVDKTATAFCVKYGNVTKWVPYVNDDKTEKMEKDDDGQLLGMEAVEVNSKIVKPSYAMTVHTAQGSQYDCVVFYCPKWCHWVSRNMIYTALTRARKEVYVIGNLDLLASAIRNKLEPDFGEDLLTE